MKLFFCISCHDLVRMFDNKRTCKCKKSWGKYIDEINATIGGEAVPIGVDNNTFAKAIRAKDAPRGLEFNAFVIGMNSDRVTRER